VRHRSTCFGVKPKLTQQFSPRVTDYRVNATRKTPAS
jgi:hypothetical protein